MGTNIRLDSTTIAVSREIAAPIVTAATMVFVGGLLFFFGAPAFMQLHADSFRDLFLGRWITQHGIPHREVFALANRGHVAVVQQWLADWSSYQVWRLAGYQGLAIFNAAAFAAAYAILAGVMRTVKSSAPVAIAFACFAALSVFTLVFIRAQTLSLPLFPVLLWLCVTDARQDQLRWPTLLLIPVLVLWANLHGSVVLGAGLAAGYLGFRAAEMARRRRLRPAGAYACLAIAAGAAVVATPYGSGILHYYNAFVGNAAMRAADIEWDPPAFPALSFYQFTVPIILSIASVTIAWRRGRRLPWLLIGAAGVTGVAALIAMRNNVWLGMTAGLLIAETARAWMPTQPVTRSFVAGICVLGLALTAFGTSRLAAESTSGFEALEPVRAVDAAASYASTHPCAGVLADVMSVSALLWRHPALTGRVAYDGQSEAYSQRALFAWVAFEHATTPDSLRIARSFQLLLAKKTSELSRRLANLPGVVPLMSDAHGLAVVNRDAPSRALAVCKAQPPAGHGGGTG